ncbi:Protein enhanced disease resistance 2 [Vitis vinifera]|uniref:Protein enhanced disease resistance 2 n=1 Tax=Vitis vinifera TaxID=29760 RepID=A0A438FWU4_VITVI|nr:Protein enhanced disease resistance 2 [Vitis vinifera]
MQFRKPSLDFLMARLTPVDWEYLWDRLAPVNWEYLHMSKPPDWFVWPRDLCYVRYWRRNDDGSYVVLFRSREHENCGPQPGFVRAHLESGGFNISPLKPRNGRPRTQVQHLMQIDLKGWGAGYISSFQQHCLLQVLNSVAGIGGVIIDHFGTVLWTYPKPIGIGSAIEGKILALLESWNFFNLSASLNPCLYFMIGLREWFSQTDERNAQPRIPVMVNMASASVTSKKNQKPQEYSDQSNATGRNSMMMDEDSDEDEEFQVPEREQEAYSMSLQNEVKGTAMEEEPQDKIDVSCFSGNLRRDDRDKGRDCWTISDGNNFRVRCKHFFYDKTKVLWSFACFLLLVFLEFS